MTKCLLAMNETVRANHKLKLFADLFFSPLLRDSTSGDRDNELHRNYKMQFFGQ